MDEEKLKRWADQLTAAKLEWELYAVDGQSTSIEVREGQVDTFKSSRNQGYSLRVRIDQRIGFSFSSDLSDQAFARTLDQAKASAQALEPNEFAGFAHQNLPTAELNLLGAGIERPTEEKVAAAIGVEKAALAVDPRVKRVRKASYGESSGREWLFNSHGLSRKAEGTFFSSSVLAIAEENGESQTGGEFTFGRSWDALEFDRIGREAGEKAVKQLGAKPLATGVRTIVLENSVVVDLLGVLASSFIAESVQRNRSMLAGKLGEAIMAPIVHVIDDGLDVRGSSAFPFDGEGMPHQTTALVRAGVLENFLYDIETGARDNRPSTGNSGRGGFRSPPGPGPTNLRLEPGSGSLEELCAEAGNGFLVTDLMGVHTANPVSGDFSLGAAGFEIQGGKIGRPVRGVAIADNVLGIFRRTARIGGDFRYFGSVGAPSLIVPGVTVSGG
jgi:PmbA protein